MTDYIKRHRIWQLALAAMLLAGLYWGIFATDRYVSESHVVVENVQAPKLPQLDIASLVSGAGHSGSRELMLLRDYLLSVDMLAKLDAKLDLRGHYSDSLDPFSRLWWKEISMEWFHWHYLRRVQAEYDDYAGVLVIRAQAYTPAMAHAIASALVQEGERFMNDMAQQLAREQVAFAEKEVVDVGKRVVEARQALLVYQNQHGLVSPRTTVENLTAVVSRLEGELAVLQSRRRMMVSYLAPDSADVAQVSAQINAFEQQIHAERARLASPSGSPLNRVAEQYERLMFEAEFAQDLYKTGMAALEMSRLEASRTLKKVSVLQSPTMPEYPLEPRRTYNIVVFILATLLMAGGIHLLLAIIRDHRE